MGVNFPFTRTKSVTGFVADGAPNAVDPTTPVDLTHSLPIFPENASMSAGNGFVVFPGFSSGAGTVDFEVWGQDLTSGRWAMIKAFAAAPTDVMVDPVKVVPGSRLFVRVTAHAGGPGGGQVTTRGALTVL
jgi:hypothetical protein